MSRQSVEMKKYEQATAAFLRNMENTGATKTTVFTYASRLNLFYEYMINNGFSSKGPCYTAVLGWRDDLLSHTCFSTVYQYLLVLSRFFSWASDENNPERQYEANPVSKTLFPSKKKIAPRPYGSLLTDEQVMLLCRNNSSLSYNGPHYWERNYAIVVLIITTALRNCEILDLRGSDLDFDNEVITVRNGKGDKFREVDFPLLAQTAIKLYLQSDQHPALADNDYLFGNYGNPTSSDSSPREWKKGHRNWLSVVIRQHVYRVTGVQNITSHDLRHVSARLDLNSGMRIEELQAKLGHESPSTTQIYSGKLMTKKHRNSAKQVFEEMQIQAMRNAQSLSHAI